MPPSHFILWYRVRLVMKEIGHFKSRMWATNHEQLSSHLSTPISRKEFVYSARQYLNTFLQHITHRVIANQSTLFRAAKAHKTQWRVATTCSRVTWCDVTDGVPLLLDVGWLLVLSIRRLTSWHCLCWIIFLIEPLIYYLCRREILPDFIIVNKWRIMQRKLVFFYFPRQHLRLDRYKSYFIFH